MTLPRHVQAHLIDIGVIDDDRVTAKPRLRRCRSCRQQTLSALADDGPGVAGIRVDLDPGVLTDLGELQALLAGVATYDDTGAGVTWRCPIRIGMRKASTRKVHATHSCAGNAFDKRRSTPPTNTRPISDPTTIPF